MPAVIVRHVLNLGIFLQGKVIGPDLNLARLLCIGEDFATTTYTEYEFTERIIFKSKINIINAPFCRRSPNDDGPVPPTALTSDDVQLNSASLVRLTFPSTQTGGAIFRHYQS